VLLKAGRRGPSAPRAPVIGFCGLGVGLKIEAGSRPAGLLRLDLHAVQEREARLLGPIDHCISTKADSATVSNSYPARPASSGKPDSRLWPL
jgi:hypothetical protein